MYRRRRVQREKIAFGFDSFLDVVANLIGIIIRLILVAWVGARAYHASMVLEEADFPFQEPPAPQASDDPLAAVLSQARLELDKAQARLLEHLRLLEQVERKGQDQQQSLAQVTARRKALAQEMFLLDRTAKAPPPAPPPDLEELSQRGRELSQEIQSLARQPVPKKVLRHPVPVSRDLQGDEFFFECRAGRVTFIDLPAFLQEIQAGMENKIERLKTQWRATGTTTQAGAFRLRYVVERLQDIGEFPGSHPPEGSFRYGLGEWTLEPVLAQRGETLEQALRPQSFFRHQVDRLDPHLAGVTFWVYPDSFALFRGLRDYLYARDLVVAGRPLPAGAAIRASRFGTKSRGQ